MNWGTTTMLVHRLVSKSGSYILTGLLVAVVASGSVAEGQKRGKTVGDLLKGIQRDAKKVNIKKNRSSLPTFKKIQRRKSINLNRVKPPSSGKLYYKSGTNEAELERITDEGINQLYKLTKRFKRSSKRGELWLRLAEQYVEKARLIEYRLQQKYDDQLKAFEEKKTKRRPRLNLKPAQE